LEQLRHRRFSDEVILTRTKAETVT
jgi:hypothetical protein